MAGSITSSIPILPSLDLERSLAFCERLGFTRVALYPGAYAIAERGSVELHYWFTDDPELPKASACYLRITDPAGLYAAFRAAGVERMTEPEAKPWGVVEFVVWDPDGNLYRLGELI